MVSIESGCSLGGGFDAPDKLATKARNENFPIASHLLPSDVRANLMAIYGGDSGTGLEPGPVSLPHRGQPGGPARDSLSELR